MDVSIDEGIRTCLLGERELISSNNDNIQIELNQHKDQIIILPKYFAYSLFQSFHSLRDNIANYYFCFNIELRCDFSYIKTFFEQGSIHFGDINTKQIYDFYYSLGKCLNEFKACDFITQTVIEFLNKNNNKEHLDELKKIDCSIILDRLYLKNMFKQDNSLEIEYFLNNFGELIRKEAFRNWFSKNDHYPIIEMIYEKLTLLKLHEDDLIDLLYQLRIYKGLDKDITDKCLGKINMSFCSIEKYQKYIEIKGENNAHVNHQYFKHENIGRKLRPWQNKISNDKIYNIISPRFYYRKQFKVECIIIKTSSQYNTKQGQHWKIEGLNPNKNNWEEMCDDQIQLIPSCINYIKLQSMHAVSQIRIVQTGNVALDDLFDLNNLSVYGHFSKYANWVYWLILSIIVLMICYVFFANIQSPISIPKLMYNFNQKNNKIINDAKYEPQKITHVISNNLQPQHNTTCINNEL